MHVRLVHITFTIPYEELRGISMHNIVSRDGSRLRPFPSSPEPLIQNEGRCSAFDTEIIFHSHANKTHFHKKGCAPSLILKVRVFGTRKWPIDMSHFVRHSI